MKKVRSGYLKGIHPRGGTGRAKMWGPRAMCTDPLTFSSVILAESTDDNRDRHCVRALRNMHCDNKLRLANFSRCRGTETFCQSCFLV